MCVSVGDIGGLAIATMRTRMATHLHAAVTWLWLGLHRGPRVAAIRHGSKLKLCGRVCNMLCACPFVTLHLLWAVAVRHGSTGLKFSSKPRPRIVSHAHCKSHTFKPFSSTHQTHHKSHASKVQTTYYCMCTHTHTHTHTHTVCVTQTHTRAHTHTQHTRTHPPPHRAQQSAPCGDLGRLVAARDRRTPAYAARPLPALRLVLLGLALR